jgi:HSP20 family molecular chaperone IbpA
MNNDAVKRTASKPMVVGLVTLILGVLIGVAAEKYVGRGSITVRKADFADASKSSNVKTPRRLLPDPFDDDAFDSWDPFREMRSLQAEMDEMFRRSIARFRMNPQMGIFKDDAGYSLSLDVRELKDRFEVRAFLPDAKASDAKVNLKGNRLEVEVSHRQTERQQGKNEPDTVTEWGRYTQTVELAGNLKSDQMKVERKDHELLITIPKA